jgi:hypothetical protein
MTTTKRYMSNKKSSQQTISISPALRDWIRRYVSVMHKKNPEDKDYGSISAFYCSVMENVLKIFEKGKTLEDFERLQNSELLKLFNEEGKFHLPFLEATVEMNALTPLDYFFAKPMRQFLFQWFNLFFKKLDPYSMKCIQNIFTMVRNRSYENHIVKECRWEIFPKKGSKGFEGTFECKSDYNFIHLNNIKVNIAFMALLGIKVTDLHYSREENYARVKFTTTDLYFNPEEVFDERLALATENVDYLINFFRIIEHGTPHLWQRLSNNTHHIISFRNKEDFNKCIINVESNLKKYGSKEEYGLYILKFFEQIHWIRIIDQKDLSFHDFFLIL